MLRLFVAIDISSEIADEIEMFETALRRYDLDIRWIPKTNLHLTLKFLGSVDPKRLPSIQEEMTHLCATTEIFTAHLAELGIFPDREHPQVLWIGADEGSEPLAELAKETEEAMKRVGFPSLARAFTPHLTVGRFKSNLNLDNFRVAMEEINFRSAYTLRIDHLSLYRSYLREHGPQYECISRSDFI